MMAESLSLGAHVKHTRRNPCPCCGKDSCVTFSDGATLCLRRESDHRTRTGIGWLHGGGSDWRDQTFAPPPPSREPPTPPPDPDIRHQGLRRILAQCPLAPAHRDQLRRRGLTDAEIDALPVGSLPDTGPARDAIAAAVIADPGPEAYGNVPGLHRETDGRPALAGYAGMLIGVERGGRLVGLVVRPDDPTVRETGKYRWLSSKDKPGGVGSGAPCGVVFPIGWVSGTPAPTVVITEGILKGYVAANRLGLPVIAMPGATITGEVQNLLAEMGAAEAGLAFDNDRETNAHVAAAEHGLAEDLATAGLTVSRMAWPAQHKGLDDALAAGTIPRIVPHPVSLDDLSHCSVEVARLEHELAAERQRYDNLHDLHVAMIAAYRAPHLGPERTTATSIVLDLARKPRGEWQKIPAQRVAEGAGISERAVPRQMEKIKPLLADAGVIEFKKVWMPEVVNQQTGQVSGGHHMTHARLVAEPLAALQVIATAVPSAGHKNNVGSNGHRCRCGSTNIIRHYVDKCADCGEVITTGKIRMDKGNCQVVSPPPGDIPAGPEPDPQDTPVHTLSPEYVLSTTVLATSHNDEEPAWLADAPNPEGVGEGEHEEPPGLTGPLTASDRVAERQRVAHAKADILARTGRAARGALASADHATDRVGLHEATADLMARLEPVAAARGRSPVPKPTPAVLPNMPPEPAPPDRYTL